MSITREKETGEILEVKIFKETTDRQSKERKIQNMSLCLEIVTDSNNLF